MKNAQYGNNENNFTRLKNFPISFFSIIMGLSGFGIAWRKGSSVLESTSLQPYADFNISTLMGTISDGIILFTVGVFALVSLVYLTKLIRYPQAVVGETKHPVKLSFFPAISISMLLLSICFLHCDIAFLKGLAKGFWMVGAGLHLIFTLYVISSWMHHDHYETVHINPAWFIPAVGNVLVPIAGVSLGFTEISWFFFSIGIIFWIILFSLLFNRVLFHNPMPTHLIPTFFILIAPPAVGFLSYLKLNHGELDNFAHMMYYIALFLTLLLFMQIRRFSKLPFFLSWWAYSFPIAAITISTFTMFELKQQPFYLGLGAILLTIITMVIALLVVRTLIAIFRKKICVEG
jgi:tellurite resistance protein